MTGINEGRVVAVTGAGRGIGREYVLEFAREGAKVVVNDLGGAPDGTRSSSGPAEAVAQEIKSLGGDAVANAGNVSSGEGSRHAHLERIASRFLDGSAVEVVA